MELAGGIVKVPAAQDEVETLDDALSYLLVDRHLVVEKGCSDL